MVSCLESFSLESFSLACLAFDLDYVLVRTKLKSCFNSIPYGVPSLLLLNPQQVGTPT